MQKSRCPPQHITEDMFIQEGPIPAFFQSFLVALLGPLFTSYDEGVNPLRNDRRWQLGKYHLGWFLQKELS
jgi:hypothetical protein